MSAFNKLSRAMTFDERKVGGRNVAGNDDHVFSKLQKRSMTFIAPSTAPAGRDRAHSMTIPDVMFRRHFGHEDEENLRPFSHYQHGVTGDGAVAPVVTKPAEDNSGKAVVVTDTFTTGAVVANTLYKMGYKVICVLSADLKDLLKMIPDDLEVQFTATITLDVDAEHSAAVKSVIEQIRAVGLPVVAVFAGAETGVELADELSEIMGLRTNGTAQSDARRNKFVMGETVRAAGLRAVKQLKASVWADIEAFLTEWNPSPYKVIVKPVDSAGSDDVTLCLSFKDVQKAFGNIIGKVNGLGLVNKAVLVQEYLEGQEYIIDMVSRDGVHKTAAVWAYDRRAVNGAGFVCFGQRMMMIDDPHIRELIEYQKKVITALGIRNGPTHGEVKWFQGEPVLVEVGARCQGADGLWVKITTEALGYHQVQCTVDSYLYPERFEAMPEAPCKRLAHVALKWLVNYATGTFTGMNEPVWQSAREDPAYRGSQIFFQPGNKVVPTTNCFTWAGCVLLAHESEDGMNELYYSLEEYEKSVLYHIDTHIDPHALANTDKREAVVVVDPFSTGALLAADFVKAGYRVVAMYSANLETLVNVQSLVPQGLSLSFDAVIPYHDNLMVLQARLLGLENLKVVAVLAGAETGVELADQLSEKMKLRTNGTAQTDARRNKFIMGETIRTAGIRAMKQVKATAAEHVEAFLGEWNPSPYKVIVKPMDSAGSDDVTLCSSREEVFAAFHRILGKVNGLGLVNKAVLVQEFLDGPEYVIDTVSSGGEHKVVAVWEYDRRAVNGAGFVLFGQRLLTIDEPRVRELIEYQKKVITALGIRNGPTHGEVKWFQNEPVLVEVGARCHGVEGVWQLIVDEVLGYNQVQGTIDAYFNREKFDAIPDVPMERHSDGRLLFLILYKEGLVEDFDATLLTEIQNMPSFVSLEMFAAKGARVRKTIDCFTFGGVVRLVNPDSEALVKDYARLREIEKIGFIKFSE